MASPSTSHEHTSIEQPDQSSTSGIGNTIRLNARKLISGIAVACALSAPSPATASSDLPPQGVFEDCFITRELDQCEERAQLVGQAGFQLILNSDALDQGADMPTLLTYAGATQSAGLKNIWQLDAGWWQNYNPDETNMLATYPELAAESGASTNNGLLQFIVQSLRGAGTWGYYIADDTSYHNGRASRSDIAGMHQLTEQIHAFDPKARTLAATYGRSQPLARFSQAADIVLQEDYPVGLTTGPYAGKDMQTWHRVKDTAQAMCDVQRGEKRPGAILQAFSWGDSLVDASNLYGPSEGQQIYDSHSLPYPNTAQLRNMRNATIIYGRPQVILWFLLNETIGWPENETPPGWYDPSPAEAADRWKSLTEAALAPLPRRIDESSRQTC